MAPETVGTAWNGEGTQGTEHVTGAEYLPSFASPRAGPAPTDLSFSAQRSYWRCDVPTLQKGCPGPGSQCTPHSEGQAQCGPALLLGQLEHVVRTPTATRPCEAGVTSIPDLPRFSGEASSARKHSNLTDVAQPGSGNSNPSPPNCKAAGLAQPGHPADAGEETGCALTAL